MRRLLIIGCGDVVRRALPQLTKRWRVYALVRQHDPRLAALGVIQLQGDLDRPESLQCLQGIAQAVIHSAPPPGTGDTDTRTRRLIANLRRSPNPAPQAACSLLQRIVYISTTGVYGDCAGARLDESRRVEPLTARARRRLDAERQLRNFAKRSGCCVSILRAPGIYAGDRLPLERLHKRQPLLIEKDDVFTNHIHADDLATACIAALRWGRPNRDLRLGLNPRLSRKRLPVFRRTKPAPRNQSCSS